CWRVGFNAGDAAFWRDTSHYISFDAPQDAWPTAYAEILREKGITDIVLYGDTRPVHAAAIKIAKENNIEIHVFEEGYLRPYWVTYERGGSNGNSRAMDFSVADMQRALAQSDVEIHEPPAHWGEMKEHVFYGAIYHWFVLFANHKYQNFRPHRAISVAQEFRLYLKKLAWMPLHWAKRIYATLKVRKGGFPYHLVLLQLEHDSSFQMHSPFEKMEEFITLTLEGFANGAPPHHHLVFKAHPLEDGRGQIPENIHKISNKLQVSDRIHYIRGGKLAMLLNHARSAITVNSTAAQQALLRGIPIKVFGDAIYSKPEFISSAPLPDFFNHATRPDTRAYKDYRRFLLETSQVSGGFYSTKGRRRLMRQIVDLMLADADPYQALINGNAAARQQLHIVN
ncbi:MAG: capsule biosynthesis protein, partial [Halocynthiibacter sp.]